MIGDTDLAVSKLYGMLPADAPGTSEGRTPADNATVRNVFIIGPDKKIKLLLGLSDDHRAQLRGNSAGDRLHATHRQA
jgi:alkyl hydroperoxide reductase subunit AhpC